MTLVRKLSGDKPATPMRRGATDTQMHLYLDGFAAQPGGPAIPEGTPGIDDYRKVASWLGIDRVVVTIANAHQFDNGCLLECLRQLGGMARGVAAITGETSDAEMRRLADGGVSGARIMELPGGAVGLSGLAGVDARANDFGWVVAVQFDGSHLLEHMDKLTSIRSNWILDHHGKFFSGVTPDDPRIDAVKQLIDNGNCWFKFAGCYESSRAGPPYYDDVAAVARVIAEYAPDRIIWGTNWPHNQATTTETYPDDGALLDTVLGWIAQQQHQKVLVDNPAKLFGFPG